MFRRNVVLGSICVLMLAACGTSFKPSADEVRRASFGTKPTKEFAIERIRAHLRESLIDPDSLKLSCSEPQAGWARYDFLDKPQFGYVVLCGVNAKNRFGGYTGNRPAVYLFTGNAKTNMAIGPAEKISREVLYDFVDEFSSSSNVPHKEIYGMESEKFIVELGGYCNETEDCVRGLACRKNMCLK